jgi:AsmA family
MKRVASRSRRRTGKVVAGLAIAGLLAWLGAGPVVRWLVAREGSRALAMRVTVDRAQVGLGGPRLRLEGIALGNPPGFGDEQMLAAEQISIRVEPISLVHGTIRVPEVAVDGFVLRVENAGGRTNLEALRGRLHEALGRSPRSTRRILIGRLVFRGGHASAPGPFGRIKVPVKDIELTGVGEGKGGLTPMELVDFLLDLMDPGLGNAVRNTDVGAMVKGLFK